MTTKTDENTGENCGEDINEACDHTSDFRDRTSDFLDDFFNRQAENETLAETTNWPGDGSGEDDLADFNANEADDYREE